MAAEKGRLGELEVRWKAEQDLVSKIVEIRRGGKAEAERARLQELQGELDKLQGEAPLIFPTVDGQAVAAVVGDWTGIPVGRMVKDEIQTVLKLAETLGAAGDRPEPRARDDRSPHPDLAGGALRHRASRSACFSWPAPPASARRRPR